MKLTNRTSSQYFPFLSDILSTFFISLSPNQSSNCNPMFPGALSHCYLPEGSSFLLTAVVVYALHMQICMNTNMKNSVTKQLAHPIHHTLTCLWIMQHLPGLSGIFSDGHWAWWSQSLQQDRDHSFKSHNENEMLQESSS